MILVIIFSGYYGDLSLLLITLMLPVSLVELYSFHVLVYR